MQVFILIKLINLDQEQKKVRIKKIDTCESAYVFDEGRELTLNTFKSGRFPTKATLGEGLLTPEQMLQRLPITLAQVKAGNTFENFVN